MFKMKKIQTLQPSILDKKNNVKELVQFSTN